MKAVKVACLAVVALASFSAPASASTSYPCPPPTTTVVTMAPAPVATMTPAPMATAAPAPGYDDTDILNFALNLEYLEAEFYSWAAFGKGLSSEDRGNGPASQGGKKATLSKTVQAYAEEIARDEIAHVRFLRAALGAKAVPMPLINIGTSFSAAADAALGTTLSPPFDAYANDFFFLHAAFIFEDVGVTAYKGAAPLLKDANILGAAAGILAVEAYHAGAIRTLLYQKVTNKVPIYGALVKDVVGAISNLRDAVDGATDLDQNIVTPKGKANIIPTDANGLAFSRTPAQVAAIVFLGSASKPGGFYPNSISATPGIGELLKL